MALEHGALEKLTIIPEQGQKIEALFNPNKLTFSRSVTWDSQTGTAGESEELVYKSSEPETLAIDLFFDTYGDRPGTTIAGVVKYTEAVAQLARINRELHRPPICTLQWGKFQIFRGVLTNLSQTFSLFLPDGTPVRATLGCSFKRYRSSDEAMKTIDFHSADVPKTHTVRRGDTLSSIAARHYNDPGLWRQIAAVNGIHNPRLLKPGQVLRIPKLRGGGGGR
jgi:nucleoid-associated protein YgaU